MAAGEKRAVLMQADRGAVGGVAALDANGKVVGAVSQTGDTMTGSLNIAIGGGNTAITVDSMATYVQTFKDGDWAHKRSLLIKNMETAANLESAVTIGVQDDGTWKEYALIHQMNLHLISPSAIGAASAEEVRRLSEQVAALTEAINGMR